MQRLAYLANPLLAVNIRIGRALIGMSQNNASAVRDGRVTEAF